MSKVYMQMEPSQQLIANATRNAEAHGMQLMRMRCDFLETQESKGGFWRDFKRFLA